LLPENIPVDQEEALNVFQQADWRKGKAF
jgi:hypothetical protein